MNWLILGVVALLAIFIIYYFVIPYYKLPNDFDKVEAEKVLDEQIKKYSQKTYDQLLPLLDGEPDTYDIKMDVDKWYQFEVMGDWDDKTSGDLFISISIDNGGRSAYHPLAKSFIKRKPNNPEEPII